MIGKAATEQAVKEINGHKICYNKSKAEKSACCSGDRVYSPF
jgi:hypothetical protein